MGSAAKQHKDEKPPRENPPVDSSGSVDLSKSSAGGGGGRPAVGETRRARAGPPTWRRDAFFRFLASSRARALLLGDSAEGPAGRSRESACVRGSAS